MQIQIDSHKHKYEVEKSKRNGIFKNVYIIIKRFTSACTEICKWKTNVVR